MTGVQDGDRIAIPPADPNAATILCVYHGNCADGFGAAWAMRHNVPKANIEFLPAIYGKTPAPDVKGRIVYVLDFSFNREDTARMIQEAETFLLLDHHKTAMEALAGLDDEEERAAVQGARPNTATFRISDRGHLLFDMNRSGAGIAWDYFSRGRKPPKLIAHIEDRDLWKFLLPGTKEISAALFSYPYDFEVWDTLMATDPERLRDEGVAINRKHIKDIEELLKVTTRVMVIGGVTVPVANLPYTMSSEAGHLLAKSQPFAACYQDQTHGRIFSLRSSGDSNSMDVSAIAKSYGGGGHRNAAGFTMPIGWEGDQ